MFSVQGQVISDQSVIRSVFQDINNNVLVLKMKSKTFIKNIQHLLRYLDQVHNSKKMFEMEMPSLNARDTDILVLKKIDMILIDITS